MNFLQEILNFCRGCQDDPLARVRSVGNYQVRYCPRLHLMMIWLKDGKWRMETGWSREAIRGAGIIPAGWA